MAQERQLTPENPKQPTLDTLLEESKKLLSELRKEVTNGEGILDPNSQKKRELFVRLTFMIEELKQQGKILIELEREAATSAGTSSIKNTKIRHIKEAREKLKVAIQQLNEVITGITDLNLSTEKQPKSQKEVTTKITGLTLSTEEQTKSQIDEFNDDAVELNNEISQLLKEYSTLEGHHKSVTRLEYGKDLSTYLTYGTAASKATATVWLAWVDTLSEATKTAGIIFYPISATFTTLTKLFIFLGTVKQIFIAQSEAQKREADENRKLELENAKALLKKSAMLKFLSFTLSFLSILAFAGALATPAGWAFVAAATLIDWIDDGIRPAIQANKNLNKFQREHKKELDNLNTGGTADRQLIDEFLTLQQTAYEEQKKAIWGAANVVAMILIACAPIPVVGPVIGLIGLGIFGAVMTRNTYVAVKPYVEKYFSNRPLKKEYEEIIAEQQEKKSERGLQSTVAKKPPLARPTTSSRTTKTDPTVARGQETSSTHPHPFLKREKNYGATGTSTDPSAPQKRR